MCKLQLDLSNSLFHFLSYVQKSFCIVLLLCIYCSTSNSQTIISTFLGNGTSGNPNTTVNAANARFSYPSNVTFDSEGNLYIIDTQNGRIRKHDAVTKQVSIVAGSPITASLFLPHSIAFDKDGNMFISDRGRHCVYKKDKLTNQLTLIAGIPNNPSSFFYLDGGDGGPAINARFDEPSGLAFDSKGDLYIVDTHGGRSVRKLNMQTGIINTVAGGGIGDRDNVDAKQTELPFAKSIVFDKDDNYYVTTLVSVKRIDGKTNIITTVAGKFNGLTGDNVKATDAKSFGIYGLALDPLGNIYISEYAGNMIRKIDKKGIISRIAGNGSAGYSGDGSDALSGTLNEPYGIAIDKAGIIYVAEWRNHIVRKITICKPVKISGPVVVCNNQAAQFTSEMFNGIWETTDNSVGSINTSGLFFPSKTGGTRIVYKVSSLECGVSADTLSVNILPLPKPAFLNPVVCLPNRTGFFTDQTRMEDNSPVDQGQYLWTIKGKNVESTGTSRNFSYNFTDTGAYNVKLKVTSQSGCSDSLTSLFSAIHLQPKAQIIGQKFSICINQFLQLQHGEVNINEGPFIWNWWTDRNDKSNSEIYSKQFLDSGNTTIYFSYTNKNGCKSDTVSALLQVNPYPIIRIDTIMVVDQGSAKKITPFFHGTNLTYNWSPSIYLDNPFSPTPIVQPVNDILYKVEAIGEGDCKTDSWIRVVVLRDLIIPNAFSPNGDGINDEWDIRNLGSYPGARITIFDRSGNKIFNSIGYSKKWNGTYNNQPVPMGTYYYVIEPMNQKKAISGSLLIIR